MAKAGPALEAYGAGRHEEAVAIFLAAASGLDWKRCRSLLEERVPGMIAQSIRDADTFFGVELPGLTQWAFDARKAVDHLLRSLMPRLESCRIEGVGHLLHLQRPEPVAVGIATFLARHSMTTLIQPGRVESARMRQIAGDDA